MMKYNFIQNSSWNCWKFTRKSWNYMFLGNFQFTSYIKSSLMAEITVSHHARLIYILQFYCSLHKHRHNCSTLVTSFSFRTLLVHFFKISRIFYKIATKRNEKKIQRKISDFFHNIILKTYITVQYVFH